MISLVSDGKEEDKKKIVNQCIHEKKNKKDCRVASSVDTRQPSCLSAAEIEINRQNWHAACVITGLG